MLINILAGCNPYESPFKDEVYEHEILVFTGVTMSDAVFELKSIFEKENACKVQVMYGASGYLKHVVEVNRKGDIFFPGNVSYMESFKNDHVITRMVDVGYNQLSFFVAKDNPLRLNGDVTQLTNEHLRVVIGSLGAGSVGKETLHLLQQHKLYDDVVKNAVSFATDSKGLASAIKDNEADIVINWLAYGLIKRNAPFMTPVKIDSEYTRKVPIAMGLLKYSTDNRCANNFMDLAASEAGRIIFKKYGFSE
ncbi:MAG: molybdate ABC transporter substrate-binding protein [Deferribacterales bacterium]